MPDLMICDVDAHLVERIRRFGAVRSLTQSQALLVLLESGLQHGEGNVPGNFAAPEEKALADAISALQSLP